MGIVPHPSGLEKSPSAGEQLGAVVLFEPGGVASGVVCSKAIKAKQASKTAFYSQSMAEFGRKSLYATPPHVGSNVKVRYSRSPGSAVFCGDVWSTPLPKVFLAYGLTGMEKMSK